MSEHHSFINLNNLKNIHVQDEIALRNTASEHVY